MNRIYKVIFSRVTQRLVVVSEKVKAHTKHSSCGESAASESGISSTATKPHFAMRRLALALMAGVFATTTYAVEIDAPYDIELGADPGENAYSELTFTVAIGGAAEAYRVNIPGLLPFANMDAVAIGNLAYAAGGVSIGDGANNGTIGDGVGGAAGGNGVVSIAIGPNATASGQSSIAIGTPRVGGTQLTIASGTAATALGYGADATGSDTVAIGSDAQATSADSIAIGKSANVNGYFIAQGLPANKIYAVGMGESQPVKQCASTGNRSALIACLQPNRRVEVEVDGSGVVK